LHTPWCALREKLDNSSSSHQSRNTNVWDISEYESYWVRNDDYYFLG